MPKIIVTSRYMKAGNHSHLGNYVKYIATREGVALSEKSSAASESQSELIKKLTNDFPETVKLPEYQKYISAPSAKNASDCISAMIDENLDLVADREIYMKYLGTRPGVVKLGTHGLFSETDELVVLDKVAREVAEHTGTVWTHVVSLRRDDAERMGYNNLSAWKNLVKRHIADIAEAQKIDLKNFRWYAAYHQKENNPHVHIVVYSDNPKEGYLTKQGIEKIRSVFVNDIYRDELQNLYQDQTKVRDDLRAESKKVMQSLLNELQNQNCSDPLLENLLLKLSEQLKTAKGKKIYGYLQPQVKKTVDEIVAELAKNPTLQKMYDEWLRLEREKYLTYTSEPPQLPVLQDNKVFKPIKNAVIQAALELRYPLRTPECEPQDSEEPLPEQIDDSFDDTEPEEISARHYYMKWSGDVREARLLCEEENFRDALELYEQEAEKGNVIALNEIGRLYQRELLGEENISTADKYYSEALKGFLEIEPNADKMRPYVRYRIGKFYERGLGTPQNYTEAEKWFRLAAEAENKYAQFSLCGLYYHGNGVAQDYAQAFDWYRRSADQNNAYACYSAAKMLQRGLGTEQNAEEADSYYRKALSGFQAMERNNTDDTLQYRIGMMLLNGNGCEPDAARAEYYLERLSRQNNPYAMYSLARLYLNSEPPREVERAVELLERSAGMQNSTAAYALVRLYLYGAAVEHDENRARWWLEYSASLGNEYAARLLEDMRQYQNYGLQRAAVGLLRAFARMISDSHRNTSNSPRLQTDRKLRSMIRRKKLALGLKESHEIRACSHKI